MKKAISLILALVLCLSLCACGNAASIEEALQGKWRAESGDGGIYVFNNGRFSCEAVIAGLNLGVKEGSYKISDQAIKLYYDNGVESELPFTYYNDVLSIDGLLKKGGGDPAIDEALQGVWEHNEVEGVYYCYTFDHGSFSYEAVLIGVNFGAETGTYEIYGNTIYLQFEDDSVWELNYTYRDGTLTVDDLVKK